MVKVVFPMGNPLGKSAVVVLFFGAPSTQKSSNPSLAPSYGNFDDVREPFWSVRVGHGSFWVLSFTSNLVYP